MLRKHLRRHTFPLTQRRGSLPCESQRRRSDHRLGGTALNHPARRGEVITASGRLHRCFFPSGQAQSGDRPAQLADSESVAARQHASGQLPHSCEEEAERSQPPFGRVGPQRTCNASWTVASCRRITGCSVWQMDSIDVFCRYSFSLLQEKNEKRLRQARAARDRHSDEPSATYVLLNCLGDISLDKRFWCPLMRDWKRSIFPPLFRQPRSTPPFYLTSCSA